MQRTDVQGLRGVAVLLVIAFHVGLPVPGGFAGVDVFFVISGFVITGSILRDVESGRGFSLARFYARRVRRLLPALCLLVAVVSLVALVAQSPPAFAKTLRTAVAAVASVANWEIARSTGGYFDAPAASNPLLHTWSLAVEEQFYLCFPVLLVLGLTLGRRVHRPRLGATALLGAAAVGSYAYASHRLGLHVAPDQPPPATSAFYGSPGRAWELLAGALVALATPLLAHLPRRVCVGLGVVGVGLLGWSALRLNGSDVPADGVLLPVGAAVMLIVAGGAPQAGVSWLLARRPLVLVGDLSYSLYLWHWPPIVLAGMLWPGSSVARVVGAVVSVIPAVVSYRLVEQPIRQRRLVAGWSAPRLALVAAGSAVLLAAAPAAAAQHVASDEQVAFESGVTGSHLDVELGCDRPPSATSPPRAHCIVNASASAGTVYLVGDSQAAMWAEGVVEGARALEMSTVIATQHACPWVVPDAAHGCPDPAPSWAWLAAQPPGVVVFGVESDSYVNGARVAIGTTRAARSAAWAAALRTHLEPLLAAGHRVVLLSPAPRFYGWSPLACHGPTARARPAQCGTTRSRASVEALRGSALAADRSVASSRDGVTVFDPVDLLCDASVCRTNVGSRWLERDADHVTTSLSRAQGPLFAGLLSGRMSR